MKNITSLRVAILAYNAILPLPILARDFQPPTEWTSDCVGRITVSMPGSVDVAAYSAEAFAKLFGETSISSDFEFNDGQIAPYSKGRAITKSLTKEQINDLLMLAKKRINSIRNDILASKDNNIFKEVSTEPKRGFGHRYKDNYNVVIAIGDHLLETGGGDKEIPWSETKKDLEATLNITPRAIGENPTQSGICMPYIFKADTGTERRSIATTWRLQEHPDITIMLKDEKAEPIPSYVNRSKITPAAKIDFFWRQRYQNTIEAEYLWSFMRPIKLANVWGKAAAVKMTRRGGETDFGYYAVANGDPDAKEDTPNLELYVIQDSKNAKSKGIEPMNKEDFLELAQKIAASVRHRPITTQ